MMTITQAMIQGVADGTKMIVDPRGQMARWSRERQELNMIAESWRMTGAAIRSAMLTQADEEPPSSNR
jgi:hypothetical protein